MSDFIPKVPPLFETSLAFPFAPNDATFTIASDLMLNNVPLSGLVCVSIDIGQPNPEYVAATLLANVLTVLLRNVDPLFPNNAGPMPTSTHRRGAVVKITDFSTIAIMRNILNGDQTLNNILRYTQQQAFTDPLSLIDKQYVDGIFSGVIVPNIGTPVAGNSGITQVTTETIPVTISGENRALVVQLSLEESQTVTGITYNGVALANIGSADETTVVRSEIWGLVAPALGTHDLVITLSGLSVLAWNILPCTSIDQTTPFVENSANNGNDNSSTGPATTTIANTIVLQGLATRLPGITYTPQAGQTMVSQTLDGAVQGGIDAALLPNPASITTTVALSTATDWANVTIKLNGFVSPVGGFQLQNAGVPLAGIFQTLNFLPGILASDAGGGIANILSSGGAGGGLSKLSQVFSFSDFTNVGGDGVATFTEALPQDAVPIGVVYEIISAFDFTGGTFQVKDQHTAGSVIGASVAANAVAVLTGETDGNSTKFDFTATPNPVIYGNSVPTQGSVIVTIIYSTVEVGGESGIFGDGSDGDVVISTDTVLTRDMFYNNLTINSTIHLDTAGFRIFVKNTLTNNGIIRNNGTDVPVGSSGDVPGGPTGSLGGGGRGGNNSVSGGAGVTPGRGGSGGNAGGGTSTGGAVDPPTATQGGYRYIPQIITSHFIDGITSLVTTLGGGGGGGAGGGGFTDGNTGGGGGGFIMIIARILKNNGTIQANGGFGGNAVTTNTGGGGGGGGGYIVLVYASIVPGTIQVLGGVHGIGNGTGGDGVDGSVGNVLQFQV